MKYWDFLAFPRLPGPDAPAFHPDLKQEHLEGGSFTTVPPWVTTQEEALKYHREYVAQITERDDVILLKNRYDLERKGIKVLCNIQHAPHDADVKQLCDEGVRVMCLAYDDANPRGGGFKQQGVGLTEAGRAFMNDMADNNMIIDLSHSSHRTAWDAINYASFSNRMILVASHVGIFELYDHGRNLPIGTLKTMIDVAESKGLPCVVGIPSLTFILHPSDNSVEPFFQHLDYAIKYLGSDHVCLGTDGHYQAHTLAELEANYKMIASKLDGDEKFRSRNPYQPLELNCVNRMEIIHKRLTKEYAPYVVERIMGGNLKNLLSFALPSR